MERPPGFFEKHYLLSNALGYYTNLNTTAKYNRYVEKAHLSAALQHMVYENPWFCSNYFKVNNTGDVFKDYILRSVDHINFGVVVEYVKIDKFDREILEEIDKRRVPIGKDNAPLWRLLILETDTEQYFTFYACHSLFDGISTLQFHKDLHKYLDRTESSKFQENLFTNNGQTPVLPAVETSLDLFRPSWSQKCLFTLAVKHARLYNWLKWVGDGFSAPLEIFQAGPVTEQVHTKFRIINIPNADVNKLVDHCRSKSYTLTPYLTAILKRALQKVVYPHYYTDSSNVVTRILMAFDGRRYDHELRSPFKYGLVISGQLLDLFPVGSFNKEVHSIYKSIQSNLKSRLSFKYIWTANLIDTEEVLRGSISSKLRTTILMTNLGAIKDNPDQNWHITDAWFASNRTINYHFIMHAVSTSTGGLNIVLGYSPEYDNLETTIEGEKVGVMDAVESEIESSLLKNIES
ncbi:hypothetical_protein [Candidozyma auris]|uniref:hypothetical_protein n=1 Tax=Candidozyma auris TaxID=498019 RepID=UPI000D28D84D|nr:hypothetical_protein [[Candida] auris]QEO20783.1 hypothetical_protein [[Candida] auris]GBL48698.1 hypothetical protein CAJCM15448_09720 [[Candida] auris]